MISATSQSRHLATAAGAAMLSAALAVVGAPAFASQSPVEKEAKSEAKLAALTVLYSPMIDLEVVDDSVADAVREGTFSVEEVRVDVPAGTADAQDSFLQTRRGDALAASAEAFEKEQLRVMRKAGVVVAAGTTLNLALLPTWKYVAKQGNCGVTVVGLRDVSNNAYQQGEMAVEVSVFTGGIAYWEANGIIGNESIGDNWSLRTYFDGLPYGASSAGDRVGFRVNDPGDSYDAQVLSGGYAVRQNAPGGRCYMLTPKVTGVRIY